ncbi:MAG: DUF3524 domain-containing protein, partial [Saprospiraceae bacterium]|nr:DUF3524 domain-containing protein [Saprospiraceae bacterium]
MKILIIDPYLTASHAVWVDLLQQLPEEVAILTLPPYHWKWRMHGGSILLSDQLTQSHFQPDIIVASAMLDLNLFVAQSRPYLSPGCKLIVYFHENQLTYPISDRDQDRNKNFDNHYAFINFSSALLADKVLFNSKFHQSTFLDSLPAFLSQFPDESLNQKVRLIEQKSSVISPGYDDQGLLRQKQPRKANTPPIILWNHRWEYDKNPMDFFNAIKHLQMQSIDFGLIVCGEGFEDQPEAFSKIQSEFNNELIHFGFAESRADYKALLHQANIIPVTSQQEFFGQSVMEAMAAG